MEERGLQPEVSKDALKADLQKQAAEGRLGITKEAVLMSSPGGIVSMGSADDQSGATKATVSEAALTSLLLAGDTE
jgi:hypothetical protein